MGSAALRVDGERPDQRIDVAYRNSPCESDAVLGHQVIHCQSKRGKRTKRKQNDP